MSKESKFAISPTRAEDFPEWYQQVVRGAELGENSPVRGCMVIRPWGYGIWERIQRELDGLIKATGHENAYFPLFIPLSYLEKEAAHVDGFAKECAVVTHHRLEERDGKLIPTGELEEPLIVRPTSETIIGESFSKWVQSYRDLPLLINQWANVVRWEMRTRLFLRTSEFLWQEGHTAHASEEEAIEEMYTMLEVYRSIIEDVIAVPVIKGEKPEHERFPGAVRSTTVEAMMQDRKALQAGTSHYLGQNFAKASDIKFLNEAGATEYAYTTSWGASTRLIGALVMTHGDDNGLRVPPRVAPHHVVVLPVIPKPEHEKSVLAYADKVWHSCRSAQLVDQPISAILDKRDIRGGDKNWQWIKKGIPLRIEVGPRDIESNSVTIYRRDADPKERVQISLENLSAVIETLLPDIQARYYREALAQRENHIERDLKTFDELKAFFTPKGSEIHGGFVRAPWCGTTESVEVLKDLKVTIRCLPFDQDPKGKCILTGADAKHEAIFAKAY